MYDSRMPKKVIGISPSFEPRKYLANDYTIFKALIGHNCLYFVCKDIEKVMKNFNTLNNYLATNDVE